MAHYAWSPIKYGTNTDKDGNVTGEKVLAAGDSVDPKKLGVDQANFDALVESGAVREYAYPDMPDAYQGSPVDFLREQAADVAAAVEGSGGGYFGPTAEEALMNPALVGVDEEAFEEEAKEA
jgi:hypothetical protein